MLRRHRSSFSLAATLLAALFVSVPSLAATLSGRVLDADTHRPVEGARVRLLETGQAGRTDADGRFTFTSLPTGAYTVSTHHLAYADLERAVRVTDGTGDALVLAVHPALYPADEIVVRSSRSAATIRSTPYAADAIGHEAITRAGAVTMADAASRVPGVALSRDGAWETALSIRGLGRSSVVALVDNARVETATDLSGGLSLVNPMDLERIEVMKSSGSVLFGSGSLGGGVQMVTRRAEFSDAPRLGVEWTDGFTSANSGNAHYLATESSSQRHALRLSAGERSAGNVTTPRGELANSQFRDWSVNGSLAIRTVGRQSLTALYQRVQAKDTGIPGGTPFNALPSNATATYTKTWRQLAGLEYVLPNLSPRLPLVTARLSQQDIERDVRVLQPTGPKGMPVTQTPHALHATTSGQLEARVVPAEQHLLIAGAELWHRRLDSQRERVIAAFDSTVADRPIPLAAYMSGGVYAQDEWNAVPGRARVVLGARYDRSRTHNDATLNPVYTVRSGVLRTAPPGQSLLWAANTLYDESWSASAGSHVDITRACAVSVLLATAFRSPSLEERYQYLDFRPTGAGLHVGNPALQPERSVSLDVGAQLRAAHTHLQANVFGNRLANLVSEVPGSFLGSAAYVKTNIGKARLYGYELSADQRLLPHAALTASLAYVRGEDTGAHANLAQIAPLTGQAELALDARHAGTLRVTASAAHEQGNPGAGETRTPGYTVWGASATSVPLHAGAASFTLRGGVDNALDRAYRLPLSTMRGLVKLEAGRGWYLSGTFAF